MRKEREKTCREEGRKAGVGGGKETHRETCRDVEGKEGGRGIEMEPMRGEKGGLQGKK